MNDATVTQISDEDINRRVQWNGAMIFTIATPDERRPLYEYGRFLLARIEPTTGCTLRFYNALDTIMPRLPDYKAFVEEVGSMSYMLTRFQCRLAVYIARNDFTVMGL